MKMKRPGKMFTEKIKEKDRQIAFLLKYVDALKSMIEVQSRVIEVQKNNIRIQNEMISIYKS